MKSELIFSNKMKINANEIDVIVNVISNKKGVIVDNLIINKIRE